MAGVSFLCVQQFELEQFQFFIRQIWFHISFNKSVFAIYKSSWMAVPWVEILGEEQLRKQLPLLFNWLKQKTDLPVCIHDSIYGPWKPSGVYIMLSMLMFHSLNTAGFLQLAGGTNAHTIDGLKKEGLFQTTSISGNVDTLHILLLLFSPLHYEPSFWLTIPVSAQMMNHQQSAHLIHHTL